MRTLITGVLTGALLACTGSPDVDGTSPTPRRPADTSAAGVFTRDCESSVSGDLAAGWRRRELSAGRVVFVAAKGYADDPPDRFSAPADRATVNKVLVVVIGSAPVDVSVRHPDAALAYHPERWGLRNEMPFADGDPRVRFEPCGGDQPSTQFNGAFLLRGPACVPVEARVEGGQPVFATLSFGAGDCG